ncbi:MAG: helix-turn-helix transcriptional regulator [Tepidisphaeraceae bacterium]|jgi:DNA-binding XRE family transcriptional regulator
MKQSKRKKLERAGFKVASVREFLKLTDEEAALIDLKVLLIEMLQAARRHAGITQHALAKLIGSSQSRVAKMEAGSSDVSLDLICKALFALRISRRDIGKVIASKKAA